MNHKNRPLGAQSATAPAASPSHVVCIGASAGGLDALEKFFKACPTDSGAAFVVIQHLSPDHKSMMSNLLARHTDMPIIQVEDDMALEPNRLHLIPPGTLMHATRSGHLHLTPKATRGLTLPIDIFFSSMAEVYGPRAVGIILSGTGTDGTRGVEAISAAHGFVMAQEPESAKFDGMPRSAIATGLVDVVLPAEDLPHYLQAHLDDQPLPQQQAHAEQPSMLMERDDVLAAILRLLHHLGGIDFADYKSATVLRRIERRMQVRHISELHQYLELLECDATEAQTLRREMLISVTSFFRDPEAFQALADKVIDPMVAQLPNDSTLRVWTAGVATGEEAYTLAMLFIEAFERHRRWPHLKIFATDVDQAVIETASVGQYPEATATELAPERLERFFVRKGNQYAVKNELRQCIVFARHNLLSDPPFTRMDLVVCRNTLIYFKAAAQERALSALQYAVREGGALLLGSSESLASMTDGLQVIDTKQKLFRRTGPSGLPFLDRKADISVTLMERSVRERPRRPSVGGVADQGLAVLMRHYAPAAVIVNEQQEIIHLYGDLHGLIHPREGSASLEITRQLVDGLVPVASALLRKTLREKVHMVSEPVQVKSGDEEPRLYRIASWPLEQDSTQRLTLLCFERLSQHPTPPQGMAMNVDTETVAWVNMLEHELAATRESLQATIEELETSNEELQATNEELMASNEELQSSNEELQSLNEEMGSVNAEFQEQMQHLNRAHADLDSMTQAAGMATVFVDEQLHITRFSRDAVEIIKLRDSDVGRSLGDISHVLDYPGLMDDIAQTLQTGRVREFEVRSKGGARTYLTRILPYVIPSTTLRGAVITFTDMTLFHDVKRLQAIVDALPEHIAVLDAQGTIVLVNAAWRRFAQANGDPQLRRTGVGVNYLEVCGPASGLTCGDAHLAYQGIKQVLEGNESRFSMEYPCHSGTEQRWFVLNAAPIRAPFEGAVVSHVNVTAWYSPTPQPR